MLLFEEFKLIYVLVKGVETQPSLDHRRDFVKTESQSFLCQSKLRVFIIEVIRVGFLLNLLFDDP